MASIARFMGCVAVAALLSLGCGDDEGGTADNGGASGNGGSGASGASGGAGGSGGLNVGGASGSAGVGGGGAIDGGGGLCGTKLVGTVRDFQVSHPDFEDFAGSAPETGIVEQTLGTDKKPVYVDTPHAQTSTKANFDQWYRDVAGVNIAVPFEFNLVQAGNIYTFDDATFFPVDGLGFGNEGNTNNFHFTFELHTEFVYQGGETFTFIGDDDLWTFINGKLAIDLGGTHPSTPGSVNLDQIAASFGFEKGKTYPLDVFQAERHTNESHFKIDTSLKFTNCGEPPK